MGIRSIGSHGIWSKSREASVVHQEDIWGRDKVSNVDMDDHFWFAFEAYSYSRLKGVFVIDWIVKTNVLYSRIKVQGSEVIPVPLFNVLDGKCSDDYVARVEPSASGGKKMAEYLLDVIDNPVAANLKIASAPTSSLITNRMWLAQLLISSSSHYGQLAWLVLGFRVPNIELF